MHHILSHHLLTTINYKSGGYMNTYKVLGDAQKLSLPLVTKF